MHSLWLYFEPLLSTRKTLQCKIHTSQESGTGFDTATFSTRVCNIYGTFMSVMRVIKFYRRNELCLYCIAVRFAQVSDRVKPLLGSELAPAGAFLILPQPPMPSKSINLVAQLLVL